MADVPLIIQPEVEDVTMADVSILSTDDSPSQVHDAGFDPMDICTPSPVNRDSQPSETTGLAVNQIASSQPTLSSLQPSQNAARFSNGLGANVSLGPQLRSPIIRPRPRFSPNSKQPSASTGLAFPRVNDLQPYRKANNPFATTSSLGLGNYSHRMNSFSKKKAPNLTSEPITRDSSFSSIDTLKSTEDSKANSFDSVTSVSTAESSLSRKRSIDGAQNGQLPSMNSEPEPFLFSKYRRMNEDGLAILSGPWDENPEQIPPEQPEISLSSPQASPQSISPSRVNESFLGTPDSNLALLDHLHTVQATTPSPSNLIIPGGWPEPPNSNHTINPSAVVPSQTCDADFSAGQPMMSGALPAPSSSDQTSPADNHASPEGSMIPNNQLGEGGDANTAQGAQPPQSTWRTYLVSCYDSFQRVYALRRSFASVVRSAVTVAGLVKQRALRLFERPRPRARRSSSSPRHSPVRANIRALPVEQQRRVKSHKWRKDRGYPTVEHYPFPELSFDVPQFYQTPGFVPQAESRIRANTVTKTGPHAAPQPPHLPTHRMRHPAHRPTPSSNNPSRPNTHPRGILKKSRIEPLSPQLKQRMLLHPRARYPERARRERALMHALRTGNFDAFNEILSNQNVPLPPAPPQIQPCHTEAPEASKPKRKVRFREPLVTEHVHKEQQEILPEVAPHLHPSPPKVNSPILLEESSIEQKENIPPVPTPDVKPAIQIAHEDVVEPIVDPWLQPPEFPLGRPVSAVSLFYPVSKPLPPGRTESLYADAWRKIEEEEKLKQRPVRVQPQGPAVRPLPAKWETRVAEVKGMPNHKKVATTLSGDPLTRKDLATCFTPGAWLNDEVINSYLAIIIDYLRRSNGNAGRHDKPRFHAFNSFFFSNLRDKGYESVRRWASRAKIGGEALLNVDTVFVPVHNSSHWTLIVVKPSDRTIENFDSLGSLSPHHVEIVKKWLRGELGSNFVEEEWTVLPSISPQQNNGSDCGVFLLSTAKAVATNIEPLSYGAKDTVLLRKKIVAEIMNGGLEGDFDPTDVNGDVLL